MVHDRIINQRLFIAVQFLLGECPLRAYAGWMLGGTRAPSLVRRPHRAGGHWHHQQSGEACPLLLRGRPRWRLIKIVIAGRGSVCVAASTSSTTSRRRRRVGGRRPRGPARNSTCVRVCSRSRRFAMNAGRLPARVSIRRSPKSPPLNGPGIRLPPRPRALTMRRLLMTLFVLGAAHLTPCATRLACSPLSSTRGRRELIASSARRCVAPCFFLFFLFQHRQTREQRAEYRVRMPTLSVIEARLASSVLRLADCTA